MPIPGGYRWDFCPTCGHARQVVGKGRQLNTCPLCPPNVKEKPIQRSRSVDAKPPKPYKGQE